MTIEVRPVMKLGAAHWFTIHVVYETHTFDVPGTWPYRDGAMMAAERWAAITGAEQVVPPEMPWAKAGNLTC